MAGPIGRRGAIAALALPDPDDATLARLRRHAAAAGGAYAPNTERALRADIAAFTSWCAAVGLLSLPAAPGTVAAFIDTMANRKAPATLRRYVASIAAFHRAAGLASPTGDITVRLALRRLHRSKGRSQRQAAPLNRKLVEAMLAAAGDTARDRRDKAMLAVAYDSLCRRSELVALRCEDIEPGPEGDATIAVRRGKTDQDGKGTVRYLAADTMRHVAAWLAVAAIDEGPLLRAVRRGGGIGGMLDGADVSRRLKAMAEKAGLSATEIARISGHSSRVGAAQDMVRHGVELPAVMQAGGWRTPEMVSRYTQRLDARHSGAARLALLQRRS